MNPSSTEFETEPLENANETFREFISFFRDLVIILIIVLFIRGFVVTPFRINGDSMKSSYHDKEYILVDKFSYTNFPVQYASDSSGSRSWVASILGSLPIHI